MIKKIASDFLVAQPSFASGMARTLDLFGTFDAYNISASPAEADEKALAADWIIVGQDLVDAMTEFEAEYHIATCEQEP